MELRNLHFYHTPTRDSDVGGLIAQWEGGKTSQTKSTSSTALSDLGHLALVHYSTSQLKTPPLILSARPESGKMKSHVKVKPNCIPPYDCCVIRDYGKIAELASSKVSVGHANGSPWGPCLCDLVQSEHKS